MLEHCVHCGEELATHLLEFAPKYKAHTCRCGAVYDAKETPSGDYEFVLRGAPPAEEE